MPADRERRRTTRRVPDAREPLAHLRLRAGRELAVLNLSPAGALVEGPTRLLPGTHVDVHIVTRAGRVLVRSRILRAFVSDLQANAVSYRGALAFDRLVDVAAAGYAIPAVLLDAVSASGSPYPGADATGEDTAAIAQSA
jgi:hypothetical protein